MRGKVFCGGHGRFFIPLGCDTQVYGIPEPPLPLTLIVIAPSWSDTIRKKELL